MFHSLSRTIVVAALVVGATGVHADDPKCSASAHECEERIRQMLSGRRFLGVTIEEQRPGGLVIKAVTTKSPADRYGLKEGDRLIALNGRSLTQARLPTRN